jgi:Fe-S cluster assembly ATP-binding protein
MSVLVLTDLHASIPGREILSGVKLTIPAGEVHAIMGPNGSGKSTLAHVLLGRNSYTNVTGSITLDGVELIGKSTWERAQAGLFLAMQYPIEVPGVAMGDVLNEVRRANGVAESELGATTIALMEREAEEIGLDPKLLLRALNVDLSGGEKKRNEMVQMGVLRPKMAILDEIDSGLDVDALRAVSRRVLDAAANQGLGVLAITHYNRLLAELTPDVVHVFVSGRIVRSGGPELALELEKTGYEPYVAELAAQAKATAPAAPAGNNAANDPFADPFA